MERFSLILKLVFGSALGLAAVAFLGVLVEHAQTDTDKVQYLCRDIQIEAGFQSFKARRGVGLANLVVTIIE